jgi:hypothetical protein
VRRLASAGLALALLLGACTTAAPTGEARSGTGAPPPSASGSPAASPSAETTSAPDPFGTTAVRTRFAGRITQSLPEHLQREMPGETWTPGCPVPLSDLALLRFNYWGFDGDLKRGPMVVNRSVASDVLGVFETLFDVRFPIRNVALAKRFRPNADPDARGSVTASFNCRPVVTADGPGDTYSQHASGLAVDINSLENPYVREDGYVRNRFAQPYVDRSQDLLGMIHPGDAVVDAFAAIGWTWGGTWSGDKDYMHFSLTGR